MQIKSCFLSASNSLFLGSTNLRSKKPKSEKKDVCFCNNMINMVVPCSMFSYFCTALYRHQLISSFFFCYLEPLSPRQHDLSWPAAEPLEQELVCADVDLLEMRRGASLCDGHQDAAVVSPGVEVRACQSLSSSRVSSESVSTTQTNVCDWRLSTGGILMFFFSQLLKRRRLSRDGNLIETRLHFATPQYD